MRVVRHFTATGFVVHEGHVVLHWHPKVKAWLPPGGHINENEDPVEAVLREILEETGILAEVVSTGESLGLEYPTQRTPPFTIMIEDIQDPDDGYHQHIDMIYFCRPVGRPARLEQGWIWVNREDLNRGTPLKRKGAPSVAPPDDVRVLALRALQFSTNG